MATTKAAQSASDIPEGVVRLVSLDGGVCREWEGQDAVAELRRAVKRRTARLWVDLCGASPAVLSAVSATLGLHQLLAEDLAERDQRAKLDQIGGILHVVLFSLGFEDGLVYEREIDFVLGERFLFSSHSKWWDPRSTRHLKL